MYEGKSFTTGILPRTLRLLESNEYIALTIPANESNSVSGKNCLFLKSHRLSSETSADFSELEISFAQFPSMYIDVESNANGSNLTTNVVSIFSPILIDALTWLLLRNAFKAIVLISSDFLKKAKTLRETAPTRVSDVTEIESTDIFTV